MDRDTELVKRAQNGDRAAFKELVSVHQRNVFYLAFDLTGNRQDAEDISQEVFVKAFNSLMKFRFDAKFSSWLYRITVNTCLSMKSRQSYSEMKNREELGALTESGREPESSDNAGPERKTESGLLQIHLEKALNRLSKRERTVFIMRNYSDMAFEEIVDILKIRPGTARNLNFKALKKLRRELNFYRTE